VQHVLRRVTVTPPSPAELELLAGSYASDELGVTWTIAVDGGQAVLKRRKAKNALLVPIGDHVFAAGKSSGALELTIEREVVGLVSGFRLSQSRIRNLAFRRA
jgi:hypothetical protein